MVVKATTIQNPVANFEDLIVTPVLKSVQRIASNPLLMGPFSGEFRDDLEPFWGNALTYSHTATSCQEEVEYRIHVLVLQFWMWFLCTEVSG